MSSRTTLLFCLAVAAVGCEIRAPAGAQERDAAVGVWDVRWAQAVRTREGGDMEIQRWGDAVLTLRSTGGDVQGSWTTNVLEEVTWQVVGEVRDGHLHLEATEHDSSNPELDAVERLVFDATISGDTLEGTLALHFRRAVRSPPGRPLLGTRRRDGRPSRPGANSAKEPATPGVLPRLRHRPGIDIRRARPPFGRSFAPANPSAER